MIFEWADKNLTDNNITESMHKFILDDIENTHAENPKPLEKTHKAVPYS